MKSLFNWISTPYYYSPSTKFKLKVSLVFGLFVFFFLFIFKPFFIPFLLNNIILEYCLGVGLIGFLGVFSILYLSPILFKKYFNEDKWTIGRNIFLITIGFFYTSTLIWYFSIKYIYISKLESIGLPLFMCYTFLVGALPLFFYVFYNEQIIRIKRERKAIKFSSLKKVKKAENKKEGENEIIIYSDNNKESLTIKIDQLVYISSQGNYASFFFKTDKNYLKEKILRITLTKIDKNFKDYESIIRCHKSYIINTKFVQGINGNARGFLLQSDIIPFKVPVSRSFSKQSLISLLN